jgi:hypothetical protein
VLCLSPTALYTRPRVFNPAPRYLRAFGDSEDSNGHGTHVVGTLVGLPEGTTLEAEAPDGYVGMAPDAKVAFIGAPLLRACSATTLRSLAALGPCLGHCPVGGRGRAAGVRCFEEALVHVLGRSFTADAKAAAAWVPSAAPDPRRPSPPCPTLPVLTQTWPTPPPTKSSPPPTSLAATLVTPPPWGPTCTRVGDCLS